MCGRFYMQEERWKDVFDDFPELEPAGGFMANEAPAFPEDPARSVRISGDFMPSAEAWAITAAGASGTESHPVSWNNKKTESAGMEIPKIRLTAPRWGFPGYDGKQLIINARAEGIEKKPLFAEGIHGGRCVFPAAGFYEWDQAKQKVSFTLPEDPVIYLAGIIRPFGEELRFVIITREANESMTPVHDRMPLMIRPEDVREWIENPARTAEFLKQPLPQLKAAREYEQLSFL